jgi:hypothetical protein
MIGVNIDDPTNGFCDNIIVIINVTHPESTLMKKHNSIAYHKAQECVAMKVIRLQHEKGMGSCSDSLTKLSTQKCTFSVLFQYCISISID